MNFTNNRYEKMMKQRPQPMAPSVPKAPRGSRCAGCPYWRGIRWHSSAASQSGGQRS